MNRRTCAEIWGVISAHRSMYARISSSLAPSSCSIRDAFTSAQAHGSIASSTARA